MAKKLVRKNKLLFGVCGGLGEYFDIDPIFFRLGFIVSFVFLGFGLLLYIAMAFLAPEEDLNA